MARIAVADIDRAGSGSPRDRLVWENEVLTLISEQSAVPVDLLGAFLGVSRSFAAAVVDEFRRRRWVSAEQFFVNDEVWVWLRKAGADRCGSPLRARRPGLNLLPHHRAVSEVRLDLEARYPEGTWVCERSIPRKRSEGDCVPDGIFRMPDGEGGVKEWAIEVELTTKLRSQYREILALRRAGYDRVIYCCPPTIAASLRAIPMMSHPKVRIIGCLKDRTEFENFQWSVSPSSQVFGPARNAIEDWEADIVRLVLEQVGIPMDQFTRFLRRAQASARQVATHLERAGFIWLGMGPVGEGPWLFPTLAGAAIIGADVEPTVPRMLGARKLRDLNEVRLTIQEGAPNAVWCSGRMLERRRRGVRGPVGTFKSGGHEFAVEMEPRTRDSDTLLKKYARRYELHQRQSRHVLVVSAPGNIERLERLKAECGWTQLSIESCDRFTPGSGRRRSGRRRRSSRRSGHRR